jgi:hypothetical protein
MTRRRGTPRPPRRRERTRWLLVAPVVGLAVIFAGVVALDAAAPEVETADRRVPGVPPLALEDERSCTRQAADNVAEEIRDAFPEAGRVSSTQVFQCPRAFDGLTVTYVGEVIGEVLPRRGGAWAQVNDDIYALEVGPLVGHQERDGFNTGLSVWLPDGLYQQVEDVGRPGRRGDVILIRGTLERADPHDGGGTTVRAESLEVLAPSIEVEDPLHVPQLIAAIVLALLAVASVIWSRRTVRRA